jgi:hypothetical protein
MIPKELQGHKVQKFEDLSSDLLTEFQSEFLKGDTKPIKLVLLLETNLFYCQPFEPKMIEDYFKVGIEKLTEKCWGDEFIEMYYTQDDFHGVQLYTETVELENHTLFSFHPNTLSDFIDACINSGIDLIWRKEWKLRKDFEEYKASQSST